MDDFERVCSLAHKLRGRAFDVENQLRSLNGIAPVGEEGAYRFSTIEEALGSAERSDERITDAQDKIRKITTERAEGVAVKKIIEIARKYGIEEDKE